MHYKMSSPEPPPARAGGPGGGSPPGGLNYSVTSTLAVLRCTTSYTYGPPQWTV